VASTPRTRLDVRLVNEGLVVSRERARALYRQALPIIEADAARIPLVYVDYLFGARRELRGMGDDVLDLYYHFPRLAYTLAWPDGR